MPELRSIYEAILGRELDRRNFQRKMLSIGFIKALNETRKVGAHKSPNLYSFDKKKYEEAERLGNDFVGPEHLLLGLLRNGGNISRTAQGVRHDLLDEPQGKLLR